MVVTEALVALEDSRHLVHLPELLETFLEEMHYQTLHLFMEIQM
jgi:hypothetical protein